MTSDKRPNELTALEALEQINGGSLTSEELVECPLLMQWTAPTRRHLGAKMVV